MSSCEHFVPSIIDAPLPRKMNFAQLTTARGAQMNAARMNLGFSKSKPDRRRLTDFSSTRAWFIAENYSQTFRA
ncbi:MAG: hypothetical protein DMG91_08860 [Acidobacteria bacterium]|nr:MAG: hypothetical protein DMG91_08860 [Acidobacteriota bacterium]